MVAGSAIIAIGGGGIKPMQQRWEQTLQRYDEEKPKVRQEAQGATDRIAQRAQELKDQGSAARQGTSDTVGARTMRPQE